MLPFEHIFVINLDRRQDRLSQFYLEAKRIGFTYERISAIEGGVNGCRLSHLLVAKTAKERKLQNYLVLEDDVVFHDNFNSLFADFYSEVPKWDMLYLGANHHNGFVRETKNVVRCQGSYTTHAMAVNGAFYDTFINKLENSSIECDVALSELHKSNFVYAFHPALVWQRDGFSDVLNQNVSYHHLRA